MQYVPLQFQGFGGGLNTEVDAVALEPDELAEALNVRIGNKGEVQRRSGYRRWSAGITQPVHFVHHWRALDGTENTIVVDEGGTFRVAKDTPNFVSKAQLGTSIVGDTERYHVSFASGEDTLYVSSLRHGKVKKWNGSTLTDVTKKYVETSKDDQDNIDVLDEDGNPFVYHVMVPGQHLVYRHGRMYVGHTKPNPSRIWFSDVLKPEAFSAEAWVDLDPEDGSGITAMIPYADELFVFKDNSMWEMTGRDPTTYTLRTVDKLRGTVSPKTVCQMRGLLVFFDRDTGLWGYDGSTLTLLSEKINLYLLAGQEYDRASVAAAYFGDDRLYLSVPWRDGKLRTFVMNAQTGAWSEYDSGFYVGDYHLQNRYQSFPGRPGLYVANPATDDIDGQEYTSRFKTGWLFPLGPGVKARLRRMELVVDGLVGTDIGIDVYRDMDTEHRMLERHFQIPSPKGPHNVTLDGWGNRLHSMQLVFDLSVQAMTLFSFTLYATGGTDIRGERR